MTCRATTSSSSGPLGLAAVGALTFCSGKGKVAHLGAFFLLPLLAASSTYLQEEYGWPTAVTYGAWGVLLVGWLVMLVVQYRGDDDSPVAWRGAGASLLLNAAGWTALLFTTAAVTLGADQLNGTEHDVADPADQLRSLPGRGQPGRHRP